MKQVESINEWYQMLQEIEDKQTPKQIEMMIASKNNGFGYIFGF